MKPAGQNGVAFSVRSNIIPTVGMPGWHMYREIRADSKIGVGYYMFASLNARICSRPLAAFVELYVAR